MRAGHARLTAVPVRILELFHLDNAKCAGGVCEGLLLGFCVWCVGEKLLPPDDSLFQAKDALLHFLRVGFTWAA